MPKEISESKPQPVRWYQDKTTLVITVSLVALSLIAVFCAVRAQWYHVGVASVSLLSSMAGATLLAALLPPLFLYYSREKKNLSKPEKLEGGSNSSGRSPSPPVPASLQHLYSSPDLRSSPRAPSLDTLKAAAKEVNSPWTKGPKTPLKVRFIDSVERHSPSVRQWIRQGGVDLVNIVDEEGNTPLHIAAREDGLETIKEDLLPFSPRLNVKNSAQETPLHIATRLGHMEVVRLLILAGADPNIPNEDMESPLHTAVRLRNLDIVYALLFENEENNKIVPIEIDAIDQNHNTPLHLAVKTKQREIAYLLLLYDASFNLQNKQKCTALHLAAQNEDLPMIMLLQYIGDDLLDHSIKNEENKSALQYLPKNSCFDGAEFVMQKAIQGVEDKVDDILRWIKKIDGDFNPSSAKSRCAGILGIVKK